MKMQKVVNVEQEVTFEFPTRDIIVWLKNLAKMRTEYIEKYRNFVVDGENLWSDVGVSYLKEIHLSNIETLAKELKNENLAEIKVVPFDAGESASNSKLKFDIDGVTFFGLSDMSVERAEEFLNE